MLPSIYMEKSNIPTGISNSNFKLKVVPCSLHCSSMVIETQYVLKSCRICNWVPSFPALSLVCNVIQSLQHEDKEGFDQESPQLERLVFDIAEAQVPKVA